MNPTQTIAALPPTREERRRLERDNAKWPLALQEIPRAEWEGMFRGRPPLRVFRSRHWLVQEFDAAPHALVRLSINRTTHNGDRWDGNIAWDDLQAIKNELGYAGHDAVEIYPAAADVVNVANMRHLWVLNELSPFAWRGSVMGQSK